MEGKTIRLAKHAGSWYKKQKQLLDKQIETYLNKAECMISSIKKIKAIIGPHAGFTYSGPVSAWSYRYLLQANQKQPISRVFILGPSHKKYFQGCSISGLQALETPFGNLDVDTQTVKQLKEKQKFLVLSKKDEENQHSLEMHFPFIHKVLGPNVKVVPIIVGATSQKAAKKYGKVLAPFFDRQDTIFIISSDFCHWGPYFDYQPYEQGTPIWKFIEKLDGEGMKLIEKQDVNAFHSYIEQTSNTICGQCPIRILMNIFESSQHSINTKFVKYDQSEKVTTFQGSSVSYATSVSFIETKETDS